MTKFDHLAERGPLRKYAAGINDLIEEVRSLRIASGKGYTVKRTSIGTILEVKGGKILASRWLDDRTGCAILLELARRFKDVQLDVTVVFTFTIQEEVFARGAQYAAKMVHPKWVISGMAGPQGIPASLPKRTSPASMAGWACAGTRPSSRSAGC